MLFSITSLFGSNEVYTKVVFTSIVFVIALAVSQIFKIYANRTLKKFNFSLQRRRIVVKTFSLIILMVSVLLITAIWGVQKEDLLVFLSTAITILGVAFFAQWSILSNITSGLILFFHHPLKLGDTIDIQDKDFPLIGKVTDITYFFIHIKKEDGKTCTIPNTVVLYKMIQIIDDQNS